MMADEETYSLRIEAQEVVKEIEYAVDFVELSKELETSTKIVYFNLRTKENQEFTVELTDQGFRIVGKEFDTKDENVFSRHFETIYALLDHHSPKYRKSFGDTLVMKLESLQLNQDKLEDEGTKKEDTKLD